MTYESSDSIIRPDLHRRVTPCLLIAFTLLLGTSLSLLAGQESTIGFSLFGILVTCAVIAAEYTSWRVFFTSQRNSFFGRTNLRLLVNLLIASSLAGLLFEFGTLVGAQCASPLNLSDWKPFRVFLFSLAFFLLCLLITCTAQPRNTSPKPCAYSAEVDYRHNPSPFHVLALAGTVAALAFASALFASGLFGLALLPLLFLSFSFFALLIMVLSSVRGYNIKPQIVFAAIALGTGLSIISSFPVSNMLSWDDEVHYSNALQLSYIMQPEASPSDSLMQHVGVREPEFENESTLGRMGIAFSRARTWTQQEFAYDQTMTWSRDSVYSLASELDANDVDKPVENVTGLAPVLSKYSFLSYIPSALGIWIGRLFGLTFTLTFALGKTFNLLCYIFLVFIAIRLIPIKKWLFLAIGLLPTNIFSASNYSYDWFLVAFTLLSISLVVRVICSNRKVFTKELWLILICLFLALAPKAVYFPIVGVIFLIPGRAFATPTQRRLFVVASIVVVIYACATFILPTIFSGGAVYGDNRAGTGASPSRQLAFIASNPLSYLKILVSYLYHEFFALGNIETSFADFYYMGQLTEVFPVFQGVLLVCATFIMLTDTSEMSARLISTPSIIFGCFIILCTAALISTAMYVSFTEVGLNTVIGVQPRYAIPLIPIAGVFILNFPLLNKMPSRVYDALVSILCGGFPVLTTWLFIVSRAVI